MANDTISSVFDKVAHAKATGNGLVLTNLDVADLHYFIMSSTNVRLRDHDAIAKRQTYEQAFRGLDTDERRKRGG